MTTPTLESLTKNPRLSKWLPLALPLLVILIFKSVMTLHLVNLDDPTYVSDSPIHQGLTPFLLNWAFTNHFWAGFYIPLTWLSYALDVTLMGNKAEAFHLTNLLLHAINTLLLYTLLNRFTPDKWRSFLIALLWALHPLRVESVAWITERKDVLFLFFGLCSLLSYFQYAQPKNKHRILFYLLSLATLILSLLSKPSLTMFPFLLLLLDWWPLNRFRPKSYNLPLLLEKIPFLLICLAIGIITIYAQEDIGAMTNTQIIPIGLHIQTAICGYGYYLLKTICPTDLAAAIVHPMTWPPEQIFISAAALLIITAICIWLWRKNRNCKAPLVGWLWFLIALLPTSGLLQAGTQAFADRFTYFPSIGLLLAIVFAIPDNWQRNPNISRAILALAIFAITAEGILSIKQIPVWIDSGTLWRQTLRVSPDNISAHVNYSAYLVAEGKDLPAAIEQCKWVTEHAPTEDMAWYNWGISLETQGHFPEAFEKYSRAYALVPDDLTKRALQRVQSKMNQAPSIPQF